LDTIGRIGHSENVEFVQQALARKKAPDVWLRVWLVAQHDAGHAWMESTYLWVSCAVAVVRPAVFRSPGHRQESSARRPSSLDQRVTPLIVKIIKSACTFFVDNI
jgi:hypothetical protein